MHQPRNVQPICRSFISDFKVDGNKVVGLAAVYESRTNIGNMFEEVIERGAFDSSDLTDVLFFVNHDMSKIPLARSRRNNGSSTMRLSLDERGLNMEASLDVDNNATKLKPSLCHSTWRYEWDVVSVHHQRRHMGKLKL
jgi:uncharacterized protein